jgi:hypothetical protein
VCAAVEVAGRWSCCGRRRWLFSSLCRGVSLFFFFSSVPPSLSRFFLFLTFPLYCFSFPSGPSPPPSPFFLSFFPHCFLFLLSPSSFSSFLSVFLSCFYRQRQPCAGNGRLVICM